MREDRYVTSAFVRVLVVEFVERRRQWVTLEMANDQTVAIVHTLPRFANMQVPTVSTLAQRLAETNPEAFTWDGNRLLLTEQAVSDRPAILEVLRRFHAASDSEVPPASSTSEMQARPDPAAKEGKVLDDFFDGYEKEIMKARLGQDAEPDHG